MNKQKEERKPLLSDDDLYGIAKNYGEPVDEPEYCGGSIFYAACEARDFYEDLITQGKLIVKGDKKPCGPCEEKRKRLQATRRIPPTNNKQTNE